MPGIFLGWHLEPGCAFRGDYLAVSLEAFKLPGQKSYHAHRVKELISFDQTKFPLQSALVDQMLEVRSPNKDGEIIWPDQVVEDAEEKEVNDEERDKIDIQYRDIFGSYPPDDWTFDQKYEKVALELFGDIDDDDSWETVETLAIEDGDNHPGSDDEPPAIEDTGDTGSGDDDLKDAEVRGESRG